ncbi:hypothetical protein ACSNOI_12705 [Actinomadura kijaniata]|uniref:hypothetical protein n=1 Tax=Actinomadura kijaniata TaxID=46161 RepID=UPI003F1B57C2
MLGVARAVLYAVVPAELLLGILLVSGVPLPGPVVVAAETAVAAALALEATVVSRLYRAGRRRGLDRRAAARAVRDRLVPPKVGRLMAFDLHGMVSLGLWAARRRDGVPPGAVAVPYASGQNPMLLMWLFAMAVEAVALEFLLRGLGAPAGLRWVLLVFGVYSVVFVLASIAAGVTRPHVVTERELRVRYGVYLDARIPRELIASVRRVRNFDEDGPPVEVDGDRLGVVVGSQTNVLVELAGPVTVVRPFGGLAEVRSVRFYADDPEAAVAALRVRPAARAA